MCVFVFVFYVTFCVLFHTRGDCYTTLTLDLELPRDDVAPPVDDDDAEDDGFEERLPLPAVRPDTERWTDMGLDRFALPTPAPQQPRS